MDRPADHPASSPPQFSIILPVYNRVELLRRAIGSVQSQAGPSWEIVVVDDASQEDVQAALAAIVEPRVRLLRHPVNRGLGAARNSGADLARGDWLIFLDSDDELAPGGLELAARSILEFGAQAQRLLFVRRFDSGGLSPARGFGGEYWDYPAFVRWFERYSGSTEFAHCTQRSTFARVRYPETATLDYNYNFDFAAAYLTRTCPEVLYLHHDDAAVRMSANFARFFARDYPAHAAEMRRFVAAHAAGLGEHAPRVLRFYLLLSAVVHSLAGQRLAGARYALGALRLKPTWLKAWVTLFGGLIYPPVLAWGLRQQDRRLQRLWNRPPNTTSQP